MDFHRLQIPPGGYDLQEPIEDCETGGIIGSLGLGKLVLTLGIPSTELLRPVGREATKLAVYVSADAAAKLAKVFDQIAKTMDSRLPK